MKITQLREKDGNLTLSTTDLDTFLQKIKTETKTQPVSNCDTACPASAATRQTDCPKYSRQPNSARRTVSAR